MYWCSWAGKMLDLKAEGQLTRQWVCCLLLCPILMATSSAALIVYSQKIQRAW